MEYRFVLCKANCGPRVLVILENIMWEEFQTGGRVDSTAARV